MKKTILFILSLAFLVCSCQQKADSLIGEWTADKVNVQFDEKRSTPELVKQIGEMEKQNHFTISNDSVLIFKGLNHEAQGHVKADAQGNLFLDGEMFGHWKDGKITTKTASPLGEIIVVYTKK